MQNNKQQIIVLCGPDRCGKSTIVKRLSERLQIPSFKPKTDKDNFKHPERFLGQLKYFYTGIVDYLEQTGQSVILDRSWPDEYVYSQVKKRETHMGTLGLVDEAFAALRARIIVCKRSDYKGWADDNDPELDERKLQEISDKFVYDFTQWTACKKIMILNVDDENLDREVTDIEKWLVALDKYENKVIL